MDKKRPLTENELEYYANLSDSEFHEIFGEDDNDSSDYDPSENSSDSDDEVVSEPEDEVVPEPEDEVVPDPDGNDDEPQATTSNPNDNLWTDIQQNPELFISQENVGLSRILQCKRWWTYFFRKSFLHYWSNKKNLQNAEQ